MIAIGIDNGVSGSVGIIAYTGAYFYHMPVFKTLNYTKKKQFLNRIEGNRLNFMLSIECLEKRMCMIERPMVNPMRWNATMSAMRAMEATLIVLELLKIPYQFIDSKEWQRELLPKGLKQEELKLASLEVGKRMFPSVDFKGLKDADGLLIAEWCRRKNQIR